MKKALKKKDIQRIMSIKNKYVRLSQKGKISPHTKGELKALRDIKKILLKVYPDLDMVIGFDDDRKGFCVKCLADYNFLNSHDPYFGVKFIYI